MARIVFGAGCFWCSEAVMQELEGVTSVKPGYAGGDTENPSYEQVVGGNTGHAEVVSVEYDESLVELETLLKAFFVTHDPTSLNRQGADVGTQYRSSIYYETDDQKQTVEEYVKTVEDTIDEQIVTEVAPLDTFYEAESYHHNYFKNNPEQGYCQVVIAPKLSKLRVALEK